ncbi:PAS domain-containing protein [Pseudodesulfovibrio sp. JC047]|nr:methyl-accepting chemotaxis protein [Pseudodesulfovibrio sp. JC047]NDV19756.1 PAS domain-containing protein [Pseudodesulfovibrio sp. JC047]
MELSVFGVLVCGVFAAASAIGGWGAYSIGVFCVLIMLVFAGIFSRARQKRIQKALEKIAAGLDSAPGMAQVFDGALEACAQAMQSACTQTVFFKEAFQELGSPACVCDQDGVIQSASRSFVDMVQKDTEQIIGKTVSQALYNLDGTSLTEQALETGHPIAQKVDLVLWDGRTFPVQLFVNCIHDYEGQRLGAVISFIDLTELSENTRKIEHQQQHMTQAGERISGLAEHVASATELLSASADDQAQGAQKQRQQTSAVALSMEDMTETVIEVAKNAMATRGAADEANTSASDGVAMVDKAVVAINQVANEAVLLEQEVGKLHMEAGEIGRIIGVINDIADQTNLLALNAAIEAARAGDAGRGFAVVADEVRKLAEKTVTATQEVESAIKKIQTRSKKATSSMRATAKQVAASTSLSNKAGETLQHIMESIHGMVERVAEIATAAELQSAAAEEVMHRVEEIAVIAEDADEAAGQAACATRDMAELARDLLNVSQDFRDGDGETALRESKSEMKGVLPKLTQDYVLREFGEDVYATMQDSLGNPVFLSTESYPDQVLLQMAECVSRIVGVTTRRFFLGLGQFSVGQFNALYPGHFKNESLKDFYLRMNEVHTQLTKAQPGIKPPSFTYEDKGTVLFMNYRSSRGLFDYFEGILLGAAVFKNEKIDVVVKPFDEETARAEIVFLGK